MKNLNAEEAELGAWFVRECTALGVECKSPYIVGETLWPAYIPHFGRPVGMVVGSMNVRYPSPEPLYLSLVNPASYCGSNIDLLRETFDDWGWFGPLEKRPAWYAGNQWGS